MFFLNCTGRLLLYNWKAGITGACLKLDKEDMLLCLKRQKAK